ncbi:MAG: COX15/CtaA family protein, partial [Planctomycetes bacterium]|nr:COX15/CtaA family protein [Planctomycetota bacterium]
MTAPRGADILAISLATTVAMWTLFYVAAMPPGLIPLWPVAFAIAVGLLAAGLVAGRYAGRGWAGGAAVGVAVGAVNLLVLLSLLGGDRLGEQMISTAKWISGFLAAAVVLGAIGAAIGKTTARVRTPANWTARFAWMTALTTLLMLVAGGLVTGLEAGLAVEGWLRPEGHLLILFPLSLMQRDVDTFVEHAHRLWGLLVGLTTIILAIHLWMVDRRSWLRWLAVATVLAVIVQGILGGTRVTEQSIVLAIIHGLFAQAVFATLVVIAAATSTTWVSDRPAASSATAGTDRTLGIVLLAAIAVQIVLGALFRHLQPLPDVPRGLLMGLLHGHSFVGSTLVVAMVLFCGVRAWGMYHGQPIVKRIGVALILTMLLQVVLGVGSFIVVPTGPRDPDTTIGAVEVALTTAHQATGAILLATATLLLVWTSRL